MAAVVRLGSHQAAKLAALLVFVWAWLAPVAAWARPVPPLTAHVNDTAQVLSSVAEQSLERKLSAYEDRTHQQFALLTIELSLIHI